MFNFGKSTISKCAIFNSYVELPEGMDGLVLWHSILSGCLMSLTHIDWPPFGIQTWLAGFFLVALPGWILMILKEHL